MPLARVSYGLITSRNQGGGNKKQGLPPTMGLGPVAMNLIQRRAGYCKCVTTNSPNTGLFVAVSYTGTGDRVMTSPDGIIWTIQTSAADNSWISVTYRP